MKKKLLILLIAVTLFSCKKEKLPQPDENGYILLRNVQSVSLIKKTIQGTWKIHYSYGGLTGHQKTELNDSWFQYKPNDSMYIIYEGRTDVATKPRMVRKKTEMGYDGWIMDYKTGDSRNELIIEVLIKDTLWLVPNHPDALGYAMTKIP